MIASLPMYDWPEIQSDTDSFWTNFAKNLSAQCSKVPLQLSRGDEHLHWQREDLFLSQTCIYPLVTELPSSTVVLGTPIYDAPMCNDGHYASVLIVNQTDKRNAIQQFRNSKLAFNGLNSQSGYNTLRNLLVSNQLVNARAPGFFAESICTGSHRRSLAAVASGEADICAIDPVSWALSQRFDQSTASRVRVLQQSASVPALPLICSLKSVPEALHEKQWRELVCDAFSRAIDQNAAARLLLKDITYIPKTMYEKLPISNIDIFAKSA